MTRPDSLRKMVTVMKRHTALFNIAAHTVMKLSVTEAEQVYAYIEEVMNGDGLYEGFDKEGILEAYYDQHSVGGVWTWIELIAEAQTDMLSEPITSSWAK